MDYKKEIEDILKESENEIKERTKEVIKEKIVKNLEWKLDSEISDIVKKTIEEELAEEIKNTVIECKEEILKGIRPAFANIGAEIAKEFELKAIENLKNSWTSREIAEKLFN